MKNMLITGGSGFLGRYIVKDFIDQEWKVTSIDKDHDQLIQGADGFVMPLPSPAFSDLLEKLKPDLIIHGAGTASVPNSLIDPLGDFNNSVALTIELLDALRNSCPNAKIIFLSSAAVYGNPAKLPVGEDAVLQPVSPYGFHKLICEKIIEEYCSIFGVGGCSVRIFSAYGPGLRRQILWDICTKISKQHRVHLMGSGRESRDLVHATDIAKAVRLLGKKAAFHGEVYNLASGTSITIREIAEELIHIFGTQVPLAFTGERRLGDPLHWQADISRICGLGFKPAVRIKDGLCEYAKWFINNA